MKGVYSICVFSLGFSLACHQTGRSIPPYYSFDHQYELILKSAERNGNGVSVASAVDVTGEHFEDSQVGGAIVTQNCEFWLDVWNRNGKDVQVVWARSSYIDELGQGHTVYHFSNTVWQPDYPMGPQSPTILSPGAGEEETIAPGYKTYNVEDRDGSLHVFQEPLVPTSLRGRSPEQMKAYVDDLAKRQVPVKLVLPIEIGGERFVYTFTFVLRPR